MKLFTEDLKMNDIPIETEDAQNMVMRIDRNITLNTVVHDSVKIKRKFAKVKQIIIDLELELDELNDLKAPNM